MNTNNLLTYLLYGLLGLLICLAGYKACEMQKEKKQKAAEEAELQKTLRDMGIVEDDTTATTGSSYTSTETTPTSTAPAPSAGTKPTESRPVSSAPTTTTPPKNSVAAPKTDSKATTAAAPKTTTTTKSVSTTKPTVPKLTQVGTTSKGLAAVKGPGTGRWAVRAGTFSSKENARKRLEQVIKAGYPNAEISPASNGQFAVVVYRSNDKVAASKIMDKLEEKGIDAAVFDRSK